MVKSTVLVVEDSQVQKLANEEMLTRAGYLVLLAGNGEARPETTGEVSERPILLPMIKRVKTESPQIPQPCLGAGVATHS